MAFDITDFKVQTAILEIRYPMAFRLWDGAGEIALGLQHHFPKLKFNEAEPASQKYALSERARTEIFLDKAFIAETYPSASLDAFGKDTDALFDTVLAVLKPSQLERIGFRVIFEKRFSGKLAASEYFQTFNPSHEKAGKHFNIEGGEIVDGEIFYRWEGGKLGCSVKALTQEKRLELAAHPEFEEMKALEEKANLVLIDVDYYAFAPTPVDRFRPSAVIEGWFRLIKRDIGAFLNV